MKLYNFPPSPTSLRVQAVAYELGLDFELIPVDLTKGDQINAEFIRLNPNHEIPTLVDGDFCLWESSAIVTYLAEKKGEGNLMPVEMKERASMYQWMAWNTAKFTPNCISYVFERSLKEFLNLGSPDPKEIERTDAEFHRLAALLNEHLKGRDTMVGNVFSLADYVTASMFAHRKGNYSDLSEGEEYLFPGMTNRLRSEGAQLPLDKYEEVARWSKGVMGTDGWQKALATIKK